MTKKAQFERGVEQFNRRHFFEAHETWEEIWLASPEPERTFLQGIIQVAAAFHHYTHGNRAGAHSLLKAGVKKLDRAAAPPAYCRIHLEEVCAEARRWITALDAGEDPGRDALPQIRSL